MWLLLCDISYEVLEACPLPTLVPTLEEDVDVVAIRNKYWYVEMSHHCRPARWHFGTTNHSCANNNKRPNLKHLPGKARGRLLVFFIPLVIEFASLTSEKCHADLGILPKPVKA